MRFKTNLVVGLVFVALLGYVYVFEIKEREEQREAAEKSSLLLDIEEGDVAKLTIDKGDTVIVVESRQDGWWLVEPVSDLADDAAVDRLLRNLRESQRERVIVDSSTVAATPDRAVQYQLQPPRLEVTVEGKPDAGGSRTIRFGADNPTDTYVYVQQGGDNPEIFTVRAWRFDNVDKGVFDLRDRRVLAFEQEEVRDISLGYAGNRIDIVKSDDDWRLRQPIDAEADADAVDDLLRRLDDGKIASFVDEDPEAEELTEYGMEHPMVTVALTVGDDRAEKRLTVAGEAGNRNGGRLAVDASRAPVFEIDSTLVKQLQLTVFDLRNREPMKFDKDAVTRLEFSGSHGRIVAAKDTADNGSLTEPETTAAKSWVIRGFLSDVERLEVVEFARDNVAADGMAEFGLAEPAIRVDLYAGEEHALGLSVGAEHGQHAFVTRSGVSSVYSVDLEKVEGIDLDVQDVWDKREKETQSPDESQTD